MKRAGITNVTIIAKAKDPVIKFVSHLSVNISINHVNSGEMVFGLLKELPALCTLVLIIKAFLSKRSMNVFSGRLGSCSIVCLAVSFLQMHPKIQRGEINPSGNLGVLMMQDEERKAGSNRAPSTSHWGP